MEVRAELALSCEHQVHQPCLVYKLLYFLFGLVYIFQELFSFSPVSVLSLNISFSSRDWTPHTLGCWTQAELLHLSVLRFDV